ncbi:MAG: hypothetical protein ACR2H2_20200 [Solirubrobacteraceae bacterium]
MDDDAIRSLVIRLSRPDALGGHTIERAVLQAEGNHLAAIVAWILAHGGTPEAAAATTPTTGLHGPRGGAGGTPASVPLRYVLPAGSLR